MDYQQQQQQQQQAANMAHNAAAGPSSSSVAHQQASTSAPSQGSSSAATAASMAGAVRTKKIQRAAQSCNRCRVRKQRCEIDPGMTICRHCERAGTECLFVQRTGNERRRSSSNQQRSRTSSVVPDAPTTAASTLAGLMSVSALTSNTISPPPQPSRSPVAVSGHQQQPLAPPPPTKSPWQRPAFAQQSSSSAPDIREQQANGRGSSAQTPAGATPGVGMTPASTAFTGETSLSEESNLSDGAARGLAFLSINASGGPVYLGPASGFSWARTVLGGMLGEEAGARRGDPMGAERGLGGGRIPSVSTPSSASGGGSNGSASGIGGIARRGDLAALDRDPFIKRVGTTHSLAVTLPPLPNNALDGVSPEISAIVLTACYRHFQPRYPFLDWLAMHDYWARRDEILKAAGQPNPPKDASTGAFFIWMLFALGSRLCVKSQLPLAAPEAYYQKAMDHLETIVGLHNLANVQALLLMVMYSLRSSEAPSTWYLTGIIVRLCISLGLHRDLPPARARHMSAYYLQMRRRIFWSAYTVDRMLSMTLGRPPNIADEDIDASMPLDVSDVATEPTAENVAEGGPSTSMTSAIHYIKLKRIESRIQRVVYRVDRLSTEPPDSLLREIDEWERDIPNEAGRPDCWSVPMCSRDWFLLKSVEARMYLLRPVTADTTGPSYYNAVVARAAAEACELQKRLHQQPAIAASIESLRSVFLCGLTLLHAVRLDPQSIPFSTLQRAIRACSNTIYSYSQHFAATQAFHDSFEDLASVCLDAVTSAASGSGQQQQQSGPSAPAESEAQAQPPTPAQDSSAFDVMSAMAIPTDVWQSRLNNITNAMNVDYGAGDDDLSSLMYSLGVPIDDAFGAPSASWATTPSRPFSSWGYDPYGGEREAQASTSQQPQPQSGEPFPFASLFDAGAREQREALDAATAGQPTAM